MILQYHCLGLVALVFALEGGFWAPPQPRSPMMGSLGFRKRCAWKWRNRHTADAVSGKRGMQTLGLFARAPSRLATALLIEASDNTFSLSSEQQMLTPLFVTTLFQARLALVGQ